MERTGLKSIDPLMREFVERISENPLARDLHTSNIATFEKVLEMGKVSFEKISRHRAKIMLYIMLFGEDSADFERRVCEAYKLSEKHL